MGGALPGRPGPPAVSRELRHEDRSTEGGQGIEAIEATGQDAKLVLAQPEMIYPSARRGKITVAGYAPDWLAGHRLEPTSRATYQAMLKHIVRELGVVPLADLDAAKIRSFIRQVEDTGLSGSTMTTLRMLCETAVTTDQLMDRDPTSGVRIAGLHQAEMRILSPAESRDVLAATPGRTSS